MKQSGVALKPPGNATDKAALGVYIDPPKKVGAIVEMQCESAPTANNDLFVKLANDLAKHVALTGSAPAATLVTQPFAGDPKKTVKDRIDDVIGIIRENMRLARGTQLTGLLGSYVHHDGSVGVLLQVEGEKADPQLLRDVCMHIAAKSPLAGRREDIPADKVAKETEIAKAQLAADEKNKNKPPQILEKII